MILFKTIFFHIYLLMTFKHTGYGLNSSKKSSWLFAFLGVIIYALLGLFTNEPILNIVISNAVTSALVVFIGYKVSDDTRKINAAILIMSFINTINMLMIILFGDAVAKVIFIFLLVWEITALAVVFNKLTNRK